MKRMLKPDVSFVVAGWSAKGFLGADVCIRGVQNVLLVWSVTTRALTVILRPILKVRPLT